jgi:hypothetical protein
MRLLTAPSLTGALAVVLSLALAHPGLAQDAPASRSLAVFLSFGEKLL